MTFYQLAIRYLKRKKAKALLLFLVFLFVNSMILSTTMILRATEDSKLSMQEKTGSKVVAEIVSANERITRNDIEQINHLDEVVSVNRLSNDSAFPVNFMPITNSDSAEEDNIKVALYSYDNLQNDSAFSEQRYRLTEGTYIDENTKNGVVINSILADFNGLKLGDEMEFETIEGKMVKAKIVGLFLSGSERKQTDTTASISRIENRIFLDNTSYSKLFGDVGFYKVSVYTKNPEQIADLQTQLYSILQDKVNLTTSDTLFQQMKAPLEQIIRVTKLMLILTFITGTIVISFLLCMWMRTRQKEAAIFVSMGKSKSSIFLQSLLESMIVFVFAVIGSCGVGSLMANFLQTMIMDSQTAEIMLTVFMKLKDVVLLFGIGSVIVLIAVTSSLLPILRANPKDTLSRMER